jgi:hypothetical protein
LDTPPIVPGMVPEQLTFVDPETTLKFKEETGF